MNSKWIAEQIIGCAMDTHWDVEATAEAIAVQHEAEVAQLRAQMAMMAEALRSVEWQPQFNSYGDRYSDKCPRCHEHIEVGHAKDCEIGQALSAAPRVLARRKAAYWPEDDTLIFVEGMDALDVGFLIDEGKQIVDILVLAPEPECPRIREQPQSSEQEE
jgi:hypothetical protein